MAQAANVELLSGWASPYVMRVRVALAYKGVAYKDVPQDLSNKGELLLKSNPVYKTVPVLLHDGKAVCESMNIVQYVDEVWPSSGGANLLPADAHGKAMARFWADYVDKKLFDSLVGALKASAKGSEEEKAAAGENVVAVLSTLEERALVGEGPFFGGEHLGLVDVAVAPLLAWMPAVEELAQLNLPWSEKLSRLQAALAALRGHSATAELPEPPKIRDFVANVLLPRYKKA